MNLKLNALTIEVSVILPVECFSPTATFGCLKGNGKRRSLYFGSRYSNMDLVLQCRAYLQSANIANLLPLRSPHQINLEKIDKVHKMLTLSTISWWVCSIYSFVYNSYCSKPRPWNWYLPATITGPNVTMQSAFVAFTPPPGKPGTPPSAGNSNMFQYHDMSLLAIFKVLAVSRWTMQNTITI